MATDIIQIYQDNNINFKTEGHKHCRPGWVNVKCPFCTGHDGYHLGATLDGKIFYCWRCGWHKNYIALSKLLKVNEQEAKRILQQYFGLTSSKEVKRKVRKRAFVHPSNTNPLQKQHLHYLEKRGFDPEKLEKEWNLFGTGPISLLKTEEKTIDYSHRILAPIYWEGQEVTFQARDITEKHPLKYLACPEEVEIMKHKHILYGNQSKWKDSMICVEGITDVWRFGERAFCTFGIKYTPIQLRLISKLFKTVVVIFDNDPQAIEQAKSLVAGLKFKGLNSWSVKIEDDPGSMYQSDADYLVKQILK